MLLSEDPNELQVSLDRMNDSVPIIGCVFLIAEFRMLLYHGIGSKPDLIHFEESGEGQRSKYLDISSGGRTSDAVSPRTLRA